MKRTLEGKGEVEHMLYLDLPLVGVVVLVGGQVPLLGGKMPFFGGQVPFLGG